jgi:predicted enzyme related to lactoylglutathione lyase
MQAIHSRALGLAAAMLVFIGGHASPSLTQERSDDMNQQHHTIDYIEFSVSDMTEAKRFYTDAFGWGFNDYGPDYAGIQKAGGGEVGGMRREADVRTGGPLVILYSVDLEASLQAVRDAGGEIVTEPFEFPGGRRFHFTDPSGNELAVWSDK